MRRLLALPLPSVEGPKLIEGRRAHASPECSTMKDKPRYFVKIKVCYYWRPKPRMKHVGFGVAPLWQERLPQKPEAID